MDFNFTPKVNLSTYFIRFLSVLIFLFLINSKSYSQNRVYANTITNQTYVDDATNALSSDETTFAKVKSYGGLALGIGRYEGKLELKYPNVVPAGTTTYIRIGFDSDVLNVLLGGSLGGLLADLLGNVLLGDHIFEVGASNADASEILNGRSSGAFTNSNLKLITDANGHFYVAITPNFAYDRVYINDEVNALLLGTTGNTQVYYAYYNEGNAECDRPFATSYEGTGISLDLLKLGKSGVFNPQNAIDSDPNNYSDVSLGVLGVAATMSQNFYFNTPSTTSDDFNLRLKISPALLNVGLLENINVKAFNGTTQVYSQNISNLLSLDLLGLLSSGNVTTIPFSPGQVFDRVTVTVASLLDVNLTQAISIYGVTRTAGRPAFSSQVSSELFTCHNSPVNLKAITSSQNELIYYSSLTSIEALGTTPYNGVFSTDAISSDTTFYVAARKIGCLDESGRVAIKVTVNPEIHFESTILNNATAGFSYNKQINGATGGNGKFTYALASGNSLPEGLTLSSDGIVYGIPMVMQNSTFEINATDEKGCVSVKTFVLNVNAAITIDDFELPNGIIDVVYPPIQIPVINGGEPPYTIQVNDLPPGLAYNPDSNEISGTPTQTGDFVIEVVITDDSGNVKTETYPVKITDALELDSTTLPNGTVGITYPTQIIPEAIGGTGPYIYSATNLPVGLNFDPINREISGTPTQAGDYNITIEVTDTDGNKINKTYPVKIKKPLTIGDAQLLDGTVNVKYPSQFIPLATGGLEPYTYEVEGLPNGLVFNENTGEISGTPNNAGTFDITLKVSDGDGSEFLKTFPIIIHESLTLNNQTFPNGTIAENYPTLVLNSAEGGKGPYVYEVIGLPDGLTFNPVTNEVSGIPSETGSFDITVNVSDSNGNTTSTNNTILIKEPLAINDALFKNGTVGYPYPNQLLPNATGGIGPYKFEVSGLPPSLIYDAGTNQISGNSISAGTFNVVVKVTDKDHTVVSKTYPITIFESLLLEDKSFPNGTKGEVYPLTVVPQAEGGNGPYTYIVENLPNGLTFNPNTNAIEGSPTTSGNFTVSVEVTDAEGNKTTKDYNLVIKEPLILADANLRDGVVGENYPAQSIPNLTGGLPPYNYVVTGLPDGLVFNPNTNEITGIPTIEGTYPVLIKVTDKDGSEISKEYDLEIKSPLELPSLNFADGLVGAVYPPQSIPSATGGTGPYTYEVLGFPDGLNYDVNSNVISGTPNLAGIFRVEIKVTDSESKQITKFETIRVNGALVLESKNLPNGELFQVYPSQTLPEVVGGEGPYVYEVSGLPAGITFNENTRELSGTSTQAGNFDITISVTDKNGNKVQTDYPITILIQLPVVSDAEICLNESATLIVQNIQTGLTYNWYNASSTIPLENNNGTFTTSNLNLSSTYYVEAVSGSVTSNKVLVNVTVNPLPKAPKIISTNLEVLKGSTYTIVASGESNEILNWYTTATGGTVLRTGSQFITPSLTNDITFYVESVSNKGCVSSMRTPVTLKVFSYLTPIDYTINGETEICEGSNTTLNATNSNHQNLIYTWYKDSSLQDLIYVGSSFTTTNLNITTKFYVTVKGEGFKENISNAKEVTVKVNSYSIANDITAPNKTTCLGVDAVLTASASNVQNPIFKWYADANLTQYLHTGSTYTVVNPTAPINNFYVTLTSADHCENKANTAKMVVLKVKTISTAADIQVSGFDNGTCNGSNAQLTARSTSVTNPKFVWYSDENLTQKLFEGPNFNTGLLTQSTTYYVTVEGDNNCNNEIGTAKTVTVNVKNYLTSSDIDISGNLKICEGISTTLTASSSVNAGLTYTWYSDEALQKVVHVGNLYTIRNLTANTKLFITAKGDAFCENISDAKEILIDVNKYATATNINAENKITCAGSAVTLTASSAISGTQVFKWYTDASLTQLVYTGSSFTINNPTVSRNYYVTVSSEDFCDNKVNQAKAVSLTVKSISSTSDITVTGNQSGTCKGSSAILTARTTTVTNAIFKWYADAALTQLISEGAVFNSGNLTTNKTFYVTVSGDNKCENEVGAAKMVEVLVKDYVNSNDYSITGVTTICKDSGTILTADSNNNPNLIYSWYSDRDLTDLVFVGETFSTGILVSDKEYFVTVKNNNYCENIESPKSVIVKVNSTANASNIIANNVEVCYGATATLQASTVGTTNAIFKWYADAALTKHLHTGATYTITNNLSSSVYFVTLAGNDLCENKVNQAKAVTLIVKPFATANEIEVTSNLNVCKGLPTTLVATATKVNNPIFKWFSDVNLTQQVYVGAIFSTPSITENITYYVTVSGSNYCDGTIASAKTVNVTLNTTPIAPIISTIGTVSCIGQASTLSITSPDAQLEYLWFNAPVGGNFIFNGTVFTTPAISATTNYYVAAKRLNGCSDISERTLVSVTVNAQPIPATIDTRTTNVCYGESAILRVANPNNNYTYKWFTSLSSTTPIATGTSFQTENLYNNSVYYISVSNGSCNDGPKTRVDVTVGANVNSIINTHVNNNNMCPGSNTTIVITNPQYNVVYKWYTSQNGTIAIHEGGSLTTTPLAATQNYYIEASTLSGCVNSQRTLVTVHILQKLDQPQVRIKSTSENEVVFAWDSISGAIKYQVSEDQGYTWKDVVETEYVKGSLKYNEEVTIMVKALGNSGCQTSEFSLPTTGKSDVPKTNDVFIPNAFTPNNDGKNDTFLIFGNTINHVRLFIYTQWGQVIFQSDNMNYGWDGTFKGVAQPTGVYVYKAEITFLDGSKTIKNNTVTLIR